MKSTDFKKNNIYVATIRDGSSEFILRANEGGGYNKYMSRTHFYDSSSNDFTWEGYILREATEEEAFWLNRCIKENRFIPRSEIQFNVIYNNYEIF